MSTSEQEEFAVMAEASRARQAEIEAADAMTFDAYLADVAEGYLPLIP